MKPHRIKCTDRRCNWIGTAGDELTASHPFDTTRTVTGCPKCLRIDTIAKVCEVETCHDEATEGINTKDGYVSVCFLHWYDLFVE